MSLPSPLLLLAATALSFICCIGVSGYQMGMECEDNPELCDGREGRCVVHKGPYIKDARKIFGFLDPPLVRILH